jgi:hypothetical protein
MTVQELFHGDRIWEAYRWTMFWLVRRWNQRQVWTGQRTVPWR